MTTNKSITRSAARFFLVAAVCMMGVGYASAFTRGGAPPWAPWLLATGIPAAICAIMALGAARSEKGLGPPKLPILFAFVVLAGGFCLALALPPSEAKGAALFLGLPLRAAIVVYGVGLLPIVVLPIAYATTFETQTLSEGDIARVRKIAGEFRESTNEQTRS